MDEAVPDYAYFMPITVVAADIDEIDHVNNEVYLSWMIRSALKNCDAVGYGASRFREIGGVFVVRRHEIDYLRPAKLNERLKMVTWSEPMGGAKATRNYILFRDEDQRVVLRAKTFFAFVNLGTGRPIPIPPEISSAFMSFRNP